MGSGFILTRQNKKRGYDYSLLAVVFLLVIIGLVILYSTSAYNGQVKFHDRFYYLKKQAFEAAKEVTKQSLDNDNKRSYRNNKLRLGITTIATVVALLFLHGVGNKATKG